MVAISQGEMYLLADRYIESLLDSLKDPSSFDSRQLAYAVLKTESTELLVKFGHLTCKHHLNVLRKISQYILSKGVLTELLEGKRTHEHILYINKGRELIEIILKPIDHYLKDVFNETIQERDKRIDKFIDNCVCWASILLSPQQLGVGNSALCHLSQALRWVKRNYLFLSDMDLQMLVRALLLDASTGLKNSACEIHLHERIITVPAEVVTAK